jgi:hypothetical protein
MASYGVMSLARHLKRSKDACPLTGRAVTCGVSAYAQANVSARQRTSART